jgi:hypothetical protein
MTKIHAATAAIALGLTALFLVPFAATAKPMGAGFGLQKSHSARPAHTHRPHHRGAFRRHPFFGGGYATYYTPDDVYNTQITTFIAPAEPPRALSCQRRYETMNVPSDFGGTRAVTITRC